MMTEHISDHNLERHCLRLVTLEEELAAMEEHLLGCSHCVDGAEATLDYVDLMRTAIIRGDYDLEMEK